MPGKPTYEELEQRIRDLESRVMESSPLQEELSVVHDALNSSVSGVIITNFDGKITYVNPAFLRIFEYGYKAEVLGKNAAALFAADEVRKFSDVQAIIHETRGETEEFEAHRKDGTTFLVEVSSSNVTDSGGTTVGRMASFVDITARKEVETALRQSEDRYRRITSAITDYIFTVRVEDGRPIETIHRSACVAVTGYSAEEFEANPYLWIQMVDEEHREAVEAHARESLSGKKVEPIEHRITRKDGAIRWVRNTIVPYYDAEGRLASFDGLIQDITERKLAEEKLRLINQELKNFVDVVSHDLKNPIISIRGFCSRLLERHCEEISEKAVTYLEHIKASAARMDLLVKDLLTLSKIGRVFPEFVEAPFSWIVNNVLSDLEERLEREGIEVIVQEGLPSIRCDPDKMYQVLENLVSNAIAFTRETENPRIEIGYYDRANWHSFYVKDNGIGIDPKNHQRIFQMFHQLREIRDRHGTGLGLTIVQRIIENHGGQVWVESTKGSGATFHFMLPRD